jgi:hypothetical protein
LTSSKCFTTKCHTNIPPFVSSNVTYLTRSIVGRPHTDYQVLPLPLRLLSMISPVRWGIDALAISELQGAKLALFKTTPPPHPPLPHQTKDSETPLGNYFLLGRQRQHLRSLLSCYLSCWRRWRSLFRGSPLSLGMLSTKVIQRKIKTEEISCKTGVKDEIDGNTNHNLIYIAASSSCDAKGLVKHVSSFHLRATLSLPFPRTSLSPLSGVDWRRGASAFRNFLNDDES